jgi:hypothetical protein
VQVKVQVRHIAVLLLATCLAGCGSYALLDRDTVGSTPAAAGAKSDRAESAAMNSLFARAAEDKAADGAAVPAPATKPKPVAVADATTIALEPSPATADKFAAEPRGRAYLFRGVAGLIYSRGMDKLEERIRHAGITASVETQPITLIGHSMGGDSALAFAETLNAENIPVSLLVTYDPSRIADDVPPNVERYINIFQSSNFMGGGNVVQGARFHGHYASYNLKDHSEIIHINIEKTDRIQEQLITKIREIAATPAAAEGEAVPIHVEVPADAAIELWDSGLPVAAHAGDTLKTIAESYHVPLWSLEQTNSVSDRTALGEGQRIVVPRHLTPMTVPNALPSTVSSYAPVAR